MSNPNWHNCATDFVISCIAMSIGLGNVWRFPFIAYENGGGPFLLAYLIVVCVLGIPIYYFEVAIGQFSGKGSFRLFKTLAPAFTGIGVIQTLCTIVASSYYCPLLSINLYYLVKSLNMPLPWSICYEKYGDICLDSINSTEKTNMTSSTELFFTTYLLNEPSNLDNGLGMIDWRLAFAMFVTWFGVFFVLSHGPKKPGDFHWVFGLYPYFVLCIMLGISMAQKGSEKGLEFFFSVKWSQLLEAKVWYKAVSQCFYSLGLGFGTLTLLSSYNSFNREILKISMIIPLLDTCSSILSGMTAFSILGNMAKRLHTDVDDVIKSGGISILFITYPETLTKLEAAPFIMAIICFIMIYANGFASLVIFQQVTIVQLMDSLNLNRWQASAASSIIGYILGIVYTTQGGMYIIHLVDHSVVAMLIYIVVFFEVIVIVYGYGLRNFCWDIEYMTKHRVNILFRIIWSLIMPISLIIIFFGYLVAFSKGIKMKEIEYPTMALVCGWLLFFLGIILLPAFAIYEITKRREEGCPNMFWNIFNHDDWEPADQNDVSEWRASRQREEDNNGFVNFVKALVGR